MMFALMFISPSKKALPGLIFLVFCLQLASKIGLESRRLLPTITNQAFVLIGRING